MHEQSTSENESQIQHGPASKSASRRNSTRNTTNTSRHSLTAVPSNITPPSTVPPGTSATSKSPRQSATTSSTPPQSSSRPRTATKRFHVKSYDEEAFMPFTRGDEDKAGGPLTIPSRPTSGRGGPKMGGSSRPTSGRIRLDNHHREEGAPSFESYKQRSLNDVTDKGPWQRRDVQNAPLEDQNQEQTGRSLITLVGRSEEKGDVPTAAALARAADGGERHQYTGSVMSISRRGDASREKSKLAGASKTVTDQLTISFDQKPINKPRNPSHPHDPTKSEFNISHKRNLPPPLSTSPHPSNPSSQTLSQHQQTEKYAPPGAGPTPSRTRTRPTTFGKSNRIAFLHSVRPPPHYGGLGLTSAGAAGDERILRVPTVFAGWKKGGGSSDGESPLPMGDRKSTNSHIPFSILDSNPDAPRNFKELLIWDKNVREISRSTKPNIPTRPLALCQDPGPLAIHTRYGANTEWYRDTTVTVQPQVGTNHYLSDTERFSYQVPLYKCPPQTHIDPPPR